MMKYVISVECDIIFIVLVQFRQPFLSAISKQGAIVPLHPCTWSLLCAGIWEMFLSLWNYLGFKSNEDRHRLEYESTLYRMTFKCFMKWDSAVLPSCQLFSYQLWWQLISLYISLYTWVYAKIISEFTHWIAYEYLFESVWMQWMFCSNRFHVDYAVLNLSCHDSCLFLRIIIACHLFVNLCLWDDLILHAEWLCNECRATEILHVYALSFDKKW